jgi:Fe-S cluster biogenesis protein NfuA
MNGEQTERPVKMLGERVETLLRGFDAVSTPRHARELGDELARTFVTLYGAGLERVLEIVHDTAGERSDAIFANLCEDPFVESLLCLHGLHPFSVEDRVQMALDGVRPYLKSHEGDITIVGVDDGVVTVRLQGTCEGCSSSSATVKLAVERAILERVPEIRLVRAENITPALDVNPPCPVASEDDQGRVTISLGV